MGTLKNVMFFVFTKSNRSVCTQPSLFVQHKLPKIIYFEHELTDTVPLVKESISGKTNYRHK